MPHSINHGDACLAYFNKIWGIPQMQQNGGYSITSSVRARSAAGTVRLSAATTGSSRPKDRHVGAVYL